MAENIIDKAQNVIESVGAKTSASLGHFLGQKESDDGVTISQDGVQEKDVTVSSAENVVGGAGNGSKGSESGKKAEGEDAPEAVFSDDDFKSYLKNKGIEISDIDGAIEKLKPKPSKSEAEEAERIKDNARLELFLKNGGKADDYVFIRKAALGGEEFSINTLKEDLKAEGFTDAQIEQYMEEHYYLNLEDAADYDEMDGDESAFNKKLKELGKKRLNAYASHQVAKAKQILETLDSAIETETEAKVQEEKILSKVDSFFQNFNASKTFEIGEIDGKEVLPVDYKVSGQELAAVKDVLTNRQKREQLLFNSDGEPNIEFLAEVLLDRAILKSAVKTAYLEGGTRQVDIYRKVYPSDPYMVGIGGNTNSNVLKGVPVSAGKPRRFASTTQY